MVRGFNRNKANQKQRVNPLPSKVDNEYDLEKNIKRINSYSRNRNNNRDKSNRHITDSGECEGLNSHENGFIEVPHVSPSPLLTGDHAAWDSYTRLDDKITDFNYKNDQAHTDLRRELESKIKDVNESFSKSISAKSSWIASAPIPTRKVFPYCSLASWYSASERICL